MVSIVMFASGHPDSACAALVSRFMNTSLTWPGVAAHPADVAVALGDGLVLEQVAEQLQRVVDRAVDVEVDHAGVHARLTPCAQAFDTAHGRLVVLGRAPRRCRLGLDLCEHVDGFLDVVVARLGGEPARDPIREAQPVRP